jgi:hypothetical protein
VWLAPLAAIVLGAALAWSRARAPAPITVDAGPTAEELGRLRELVASEPE